MDYETFRYIDGHRIDITSSDLDFRNIVQLLIDEIDDGEIQKEVYQCTYLDGYETNTRPPENMTGFNLKLEMRFNQKFMRDYFEHLLTKRLDDIKTLELCLVNSINEV